MEQLAAQAWHEFDASNPNLSLQDWESHFPAPFVVHLVS